MRPSPLPCTTHHRGSRYVERRRCLPAGLLGTRRVGPTAGLRPGGRDGRWVGLRAGAQAGLLLALVVTLVTALMDLLLVAPAGAASADTSVGTFPGTFAGTLADTSASTFAGTRASAARPGGPPGTVATARDPVGHAVPAHGWRWPLQPRPHVIAPFDPPAGPYGPGHRGVDLAGTVGQPVLAVAAGTVTFAGQVGGLPVVVVDHGRLRTTYQPVVPLVRRGSRVGGGQSLGTLTVFGSHCLPLSCLHLGVRDGGVYLDPLGFLSLGPVRLLPLAGASGAVGAVRPRLPVPAAGAAGAWPLRW